MRIIERGEGVGIELEDILAIPLFHLGYLVIKALYQQFAGFNRLFIVE